MKTNLTNWLCGLCAILLIAVLISQFNQQGRLDGLQPQQETFAVAISQQQQEQRDAVAKLANQVTNLGVSFESRLAQSEQQTKETFAAAASQQQQEQRDAATKLANQVTNLSVSLESRLAQSEQQTKQTFAAVASQQQQEQRDAATKLANQVANLGVSLESRLAQSEQQTKQTFAAVASQQQQEQRDAATKLTNQMTNLGLSLESRLAQSEQQTTEKAAEIANIVQQQTAVMHRALGKVIPVELPEALTKKLGALEARVADEKSWPKDAVEADAMLAELRDLVRQIPPWAEEDLLPRLNAVGWGVQSLQVLQANANVVGEALAIAADTFADQISTQPDSGSTNIAAVLTSRQTETTQRFTAYRRDTAIEDAKEQLGLAKTTDGLAVWQRLSEWTNSPTHGQQVLELRQQLRSRLLEDEVTKLSETTKANLQRIGVVTNDALRQAGYLRTLENVTVQRLQLLEEADIPTTTVNLLADLSASVESRIKAEYEKQKQEDGGRVRGYQQWALRKISDFRKDFEEAQQQKEPGIIYGTNDYTKFVMISDAMVKYLLPISTGYLDSAVAKIYSQAFEDGWGKLAGKDEKYLQTEVAEKDATTPKKTPQNYLKEQP